MAGSSISPRFMQESGIKRAELGLSNFRIRTGQPFADVAKEKFFRGQLESDLARERQQAITALEFRKADEQTRQFERAQGLKEAAFAREEKELKKAEEKRKLKGAVSGVGTGAFAGFQAGAKLGTAGGPIGAIIGGIIGAVIGRKK